MREPQDDWMFSPIGPLVAQIQHLELAERLGFHTPPIIFTRRTGPGSVPEDVLIWNDPVGAEAGEVVTGRFARGKDGFSRDTIPNAARTEGRLRVAIVMDRWVRAIETCEPFFPYPALPNLRWVEGAPNLLRDPLWRTLRRSERDVEDGKTYVDSAWSIEGWPDFVRKLSALVKHDQPITEPLFSVRVEKGGRQAAIVIQHPGESPPLELAFAQGGKLDAANIARLGEWMRIWRVSREDRLLGRLGAPGVNDTAGPENDPTGPPARSGELHAEAGASPTISPPVMNARTRRALIILQGRPANEPILGPELVQQCIKRWPKDSTFTDETFRGSIVPRLKKVAGVVNVRKVGYSLPAVAPARSWSLNGD